ncbi:hypothetical protein [Neptuniibacter sp. QD37_11]|uniref:hypothetical protein n=1 Tax=Neptuniibacter sp. QD37_11 TaxID=3398209 RepID=UPI0039F604A4
MPRNKNDKVYEDLQNLPAIKQLAKKYNDAERKGQPLTASDRGTIFHQMQQISKESEVGDHVCLRLVDIAELVGCSFGKVDQMLNFHAADDEIKDLVEQGRLSVTMAVKIVRAHKEDAIDKIHELLGRDVAVQKGRLTDSALSGNDTSRTAPKKVYKDAAATLERFIKDAGIQGRVDSAKNGRIAVALSVETAEALIQAVKTVKQAENEAPIMTVVEDSKGKKQASGGQRAA